MKNSIHLKLVIVMALIIMTTCFSFLPAQAADFTWTTGADVTASAFRYVDGAPGIVKDGNDLWVVYADGAVAGAPIRRFKGTNLDNLVQQSDGVKDASFNSPYGDDVYWLMGGIWVDGDGIWYSSVHVEFNYHINEGIGKTWFRRIGLATSSDKGANWHYCGDIITSNHSYDPGEGTSGYFNYGPGSQHMYVDTVGGYIYLYYDIAWCTELSSYTQYPTGRVARSPISSKMAAGSWTKFYNGSWSQSGLGGSDSDINMVCGNPHVSYNTYLGKYIAIGNLWGYEGANIIQTCTNLETQNWTKPERLCLNRLQWYHWSVDPTTFSMWTTGQTFRQYEAQCYYNNVDAKYMNITLGTGTTTPVYYDPIYPPHSVKDYNPVWDWAFNPPVSFPNTFTQNFNSNLGGYVIKTGSGNLTRESNQMSLQASGSGSVIAIDDNSPSVADCEITAKITPQSESRCGLVFRYASSTQWVALVYDYDTNWYIYDGAGNYHIIPTSTSLTNGTQYTVTVGCVDSLYTINVNGVCIYVDSFSPALQTAGKIGVMNWYYSHTHYDDIVLKY